MSAKDELDGLLADMRKDQRFFTKYQMGDLIGNYADRIEAWRKRAQEAAEREFTEAVTKAAAQAVNLTDEKWRRETAELRDALESVLKQYDTRKEEDCFEDHGDCTLCAAKNDLCWIEETARIIRDALGETAATEGGAE